MTGHKTGHRQPVRPGGGLATVPPDGGYGWVIVGAAFVVFFITVGYFRSFSLIYLATLEKFHASSAATAWVIALFSLFRMLPAPVASSLANAYTHRKTTIAGSVLMSLSMLLSAFAPSITYMYFTFGVLGGIGCCLTLTSILAIIGQYFDKKKGLAYSIAVTGSDIGGMALAPLMTFLFKEYNLSGCLVILAGIILNICVAGALLRPLEPLKQPCQVEQESEESSDASSVIESQCLPCAGGELHREHKTPIFRPNDKCTPDHFTEVDSLTDDQSNLTGTTEKKNIFSSACLAIKSFLLEHFDLGLLQSLWLDLFIVMVVGLFLSSAATVTLISGLATEQGFSELQLALMLMIAAAVCIPAKVFFGIMFDIPCIQRNEALTLAVVCLCCGGLVISLPVWTSVTSLMLVWAIYTAFSMSFYVGHMVVLTSMVGQKRITSATGLMRLFVGFGEMTGSTIGGLLRDVTGTYHATFYVTGAIALMALIPYLALVVFSICRRKTEEKDCEDNNQSGPEA